MLDWRDAIRFVLYPSAIIGFAAMMYGIAWAQSTSDRASKSFLPALPPSTLQQAMAAADR
jgi:hypothetical protein